MALCRGWGKFFILPVGFAPEIGSKSTKMGQKCSIQSTALSLHHFVVQKWPILSILDATNRLNQWMAIKNFPHQWQGATVHGAVLHGWVNIKIKKLELYPIFSHFRKITVLAARLVKNSMKNVQIRNETSYLNRTFSKYVKHKKWKRRTSFLILKVFPTSGRLLDKGLG